jgi:hypothetical protein
MIVCLIVLLVLFGVVPVAAQDSNNYWGCYITQKGDSFWRIADRELTPDQWEKLWKKNPTAPNGKPRRFFKNPVNGFYYVHLDVGEEICGLKEIGVSPMVATPAELAQMGLLKTVTETKEVIPNWFWWLLGAMALVAIMVYLYNRRLNEPGATAGPAFVRGGVAATNSSPEETFRTHAVRAADRAGLMVERSNVRVSDVRPGRIWGVLSTLYSDGTDQIHRYHGDRAYEAMVTYHNGNSVRMYMLDACGNPLIYGGVSRYIPGPDFRFEADPVPAAVPAQPAPQPAAEPEPTPAAPEVPSVINQSGEFVRPTDTPPARSLIFEMRRSKDGKPHMVAFDSEEVEECLIGRDQRIIFRYRDEDPTK